MRNDKGKFLAILILLVMSSVLALALGGNAAAQKPRTTVNAAPIVTQQPLYTEYKGVRLGMTAQDVRTKFGNPGFKDSEMDYYTFSDTETVQIVYDSERKVKMISVDYLNGTGAPDHKTVVGGELETMPSGALLKTVRYENQGFWVSYGRTAGPVIIITITIQKM